MPKSPEDMNEKELREYVRKEEQYKDNQQRAHEPHSKRVGQHRQEYVRKRKVQRAVRNVVKPEHKGAIKGIATAGAAAGSGGVLLTVADKAKVWEVFNLPNLLGWMDGLSDFGVVLAGYFFVITAVCVVLYKVAFRK